MLTRMVYPLILREKISCRVQKFFPDISDQGISLEFDKNLRFDLSKHDVSHQSIIFNGFYELGLSKSIMKMGKAGGVLIDVGANYGYFSCLWASQNSENKVFAFEASPLNLEPLINNVNRNKFSDQIEVIPIALGKEEGILKFDLVATELQTSWGGLTISDSPTSVEVKCDTLDDYSARHGIKQVDVLKIDTEGADTWVLYGAKKLLEEKKIKHIFFEHNATRMKLLNIGTDEAMVFLKNVGYIVEKQSTTDFYAYPKK
jgi:FkbM family methyltransferase